MKHITIKYQKINKEPLISCHIYNGYVNTKDQEHEKQRIVANLRPNTGIIDPTRSWSSLGARKHENQQKLVIFKHPALF
ncbi:hypothetical protein L484_010312 [Morus notabilis]|uniref:Uncharacterized protein n=1 Tax=Morus notabilis TaxID=981085 RepID=W9QNL7_9ROSA|nr:hypothetical protein L484_010312 [Morus notabilis]